jgi:hypothetical protein
MKSKLYLSSLCAALALLGPLAAHAAKHPSKSHKASPARDCGASAPPVGLTVEHGVTVYRAAPHPWQTGAENPQRDIAPTRHIIVIRPYRYNYLAVDTRARDEWGPMYAVYQNF